MTIQAGIKRLIMLRPDLNDIYPYPIPPLYTIGWYKEGDGQHWLEIKAQSDQFPP